LLSELDLNIREAHVFSTTDGLCLDVFVVDGWETEVYLEHVFTASLCITTSFFPEMYHQHILGLEVHNLSFELLILTGWLILKVK